MLQCFDDVPQFKQGVTLKILKNGWFSHDLQAMTHAMSVVVDHRDVLQAEVAGILLSERMGFDVVSETQLPNPNLPSAASNAAIRNSKRVHEHISMSCTAHPHPTGPARAFGSCPGT